MRPWSVDKLDLLTKYLEAYSRIMNKQKEEWLQAYHYIDAFAGSGLYPYKIDDDQSDYITGSPLRALGCQPPFDEYWFIDISFSRLSQLRDIVEQQFAHLRDRVHFIQEDANTFLLNITKRTGVAHRFYKRGFVFVDPYGLDVDFKTMVYLGQTRAFDVFVNFSVMGVIRILRRQDPINEQVIDILKKVFGDTRLLTDLYQSQPTLFGDEIIERPSIDPADIIDEYRQRLLEHFDYASKPVIMTNSRNVPIYALFLLSHNETAANIVNDIFKRYERLRRGML